MATKPVLYIIGLLLLLLSLCMTIPMLIDLSAENIDWKVFGICIVFTAFFGGALALSNKHEMQDITLQEAFIITTVSWPVLVIFSALPFTMSKLDLSFTDAFFEAMSGITTTGATVLKDVESAPPGILIWRALLQWIGGMGIIVMALSVFPILRVGGMQLFKTQSSESENINLRLIRLCTNVTVFYIAITILCMIGYVISGMSSFDAFAHALSTISSGGFSTHNNSFQAFAGNPAITTNAIIFMIISGLPFFVVIRALLHNPLQILDDVQVKTYLGIIIASTLSMAFFFVWTDQYEGKEALGKSLFNGVSMLTGTGFTNTDTAAWGGFAICVLFFLMMAGGCAGSTTSGIKMFRLNVLYAVAKSQIQELIHPSGVFKPSFAGHTLQEDTILSILSFFFLYTILLAIITLALSYFGLDIVTALSATIATLSNVGPGFGSIIGPESTYASIPEATKWILSFSMLIGRLEIFTILVLFTPLFWNR